MDFTIYYSARVILVKTTQSVDICTRFSRTIEHEIYARFNAMLVARALVLVSAPSAYHETKDTLQTKKRQLKCFSAVVSVDVRFQNI